MVEVIEELNNLMCSAVRTDGCKAYNVTEEDGHTLKHLRLWHLTLKLLIFSVFIHIFTYLF